MSVIGNKTATSAKVLKGPRVTEKATMLAGASAPIYTFEISADATKNEVAKAIKAQYKVTPVKVNIVKLPMKHVIVRGKRGTKAAIKKAVVYLKTGDKIDLV